MIREVIKATRVVDGTPRKLVDLWCSDEDELSTVDRSHIDQGSLAYIIPTGKLYAFDMPSDAWYPA